MKQNEQRLSYSVKWLTAAILLSAAGLSACGSEAPSAGTEPRATQSQAQSSLNVGDTYSYYSFNTSAQFYGNEAISLVINVDPGVGADRFFSYQFQLTPTSPDAGSTVQSYIGLQTDGTGQNGTDIGKMAIFSIWNATGATPGATGSWCAPFSGEGSGYSCRIAYPWVAGHEYQLLVTTNTTATLWAGYVTDTTTNTQTFLGSISTVPEWLTNSGITFTEYYGPSEPSCADFPLSQVTWSNPTANDGTISSNLTGTAVGAGDCYHTSVDTGTPGPAIETEGSLAINAGGPLVAPFLADEYFSGGGTIYHDNAINTSGVTNPAPQAVYQRARVGNFTYTIPSFNPGTSHTLRLHFAETYFSTAGSRVFDVSINGSPVLTNFDIYKTAGAKNKAVVEQFTENASATGQYVIQFTSVVNQSLLSGIEVE